MPTKLPAPKIRMRTELLSGACIFCVDCLRCVMCAPIFTWNYAHKIYSFAASELISHNKLLMFIYWTVDRVGCTTRARARLHSSNIFARPKNAFTFCNSKLFEIIEECSLSDAIHMVQCIYKSPIPNFCVFSLRLLLLLFFSCLV